MSAWRDAWSVRHWAHHGSAKFWEGCETCSTKVLQSSFGVWNWMGFFGHDFSSPGIEVELNKKMEYIVMNNGSVRTRRSTWFARVQLLRTPEAPSCKFSIHSPWAQVEDDKVVFSPQPASWSSFWWRRCYINETRLFVPWEPFRITSFLETG